MGDKTDCSQGLKQTVRYIQYLVKMTILTHGYLYPKKLAVWIAGKTTKNFGLFLPICIYSVLFDVIASIKNYFTLWNEK